MKKLKLLVLLALGAAGLAVYALALRSPEKRSCARLSELCGLGLQSAEIDRCVGVIQAVKQKNASAADQVSRCVAEARSCEAVAGCIPGAALSLGAGFFHDFLGGLRKPSQ